MIRIVVPRAAPRGFRGYGQTGSSALVDLALNWSPDAQRDLQASGQRARAEWTSIQGSVQSELSGWMSRGASMVNAVGSAYNEARTLVGGLTSDDPETAARATFATGCRAADAAGLGDICRQVTEALMDALGWLVRSFPATPCYWQDAYMDKGAQALGFPSAKAMSSAEDPWIVVGFRNNWQPADPVVRGQWDMFWWCRFLNPTDTDVPDPYAQNEDGSSKRYDAGIKKLLDTKWTDDRVRKFLQAAFPVGYDRMFQMVSNTGGLQSLNIRYCWETSSQSYLGHGAGYGLRLASMPRDVTTAVCFGIWGGALTWDQVRGTPVLNAADRGVARIIGEMFRAPSIGLGSNRQPQVAAAGWCAVEARKMIESGEIKLKSVLHLQPVSESAKALRPATIAEIGGRRYAYTQVSQTEKERVIRVAETLAAASGVPLVIDGRRYTCKCREADGKTECECR